MSLIIESLSKSLKSELSNAVEIWVAVGLLNQKGLEFILRYSPKYCKMNYIIGVDLPTDPLALTTLNLLKRRRPISAYLLIKEFFHPKVYIIKNDKNKYIAYVGSANCTTGGLSENIELTYCIKDDQSIKQLIAWYETRLLPISQKLTSDFIREYKPKYDAKVKRKKLDKKEIIEFKKKANIEHSSNLEEMASIISKLIKFKKTSKFKEILKERQQTIRDLKVSLDYPNFENIDLKKFLSIKELGNIIAIKVKKSIENNPKKLTQLLKFICDENIPIKDRIDEGLNGKYKIDEVKEAFLSKVLVTHNPKKYFVHNKAFVKNLKPFGLSFSQGLTAGEKYEETALIMRDILNKTKIDNLAILDHCLFYLK